MNVIVSPHLDDAVLSLGQFMALGPTTVVTVFAGATDGLSDYDESCGFISSREAMTARRAEDLTACSILAATPTHLDFLDQQYKQPTADEDIVAVLKRFIRPDRAIFAPLGIGHPDHVQVARCVREAAGDHHLFVYEELPYRVLWPEQAHDALAKIRAEGFDIAEVPHPFKHGPREKKASAVAAYASQFPDGATDPCLLVPERCWRIARCA